MNECSTVKVKVKVKVKVSHHRPLGLQMVEAPRISKQSAQEVCKFVSRRYRPHLPGSIYPWYLFLLEPELTPNTPTIPSEREPATLRLETQCMNQLRHRVA